MGRQHKESTGPPVAAVRDLVCAKTLPRCHCGALAARKKIRHGFSVVDGYWADQENRKFEMAKWRCMDQIFWKGVVVALLDPILPVCL